MKTRLKTIFLKRKTFFFLGVILNILFPALGYPQEVEIAKYPTRPINFIIPLPAGGNTDLAGRLIAKQAEKYLKQPIIPVNKPGGVLVIGTAAIATAKPDGYTIGLSLLSPMFIIPHLEKVPYDPIRDLKQVIQFGAFNFGIVVKHDSPFKDFKDVVAYARQNPGKIKYGCNVQGISHSIMEQIAKYEKVQFTLVPYRVASEGEMALLGGDIHLVVSDITYSLIEAGQTRLLLLCREEHSVEYPKTPNLKDLGYDIPCPLYLGIQGPKGLPEGIVKKLEEAFTKATKEQDFANGMKAIYLPILYRNNKELDDYVLQNYKAYGKILKEIGWIK